MNNPFTSMLKKRQMLLKMFICILLAFVVPVLTVTLYNHITLLDEARQTAVNSQTALLQQTMDSLSRSLEDIQSNLYPLGNDPDLIRIAFSNAIDNSNQEHLLRLTSRISTISITHALASKVNIYFRNLNKMYYYGVTDIPKFAEDFQIDDIDRFLAAQYHSDFRTVEKDGRIESLVMLSSMMIGTVTSAVPRAQSIVHIDLNELSRVIQSSVAYPDSFLFLLDKENRLLCGNYLESNAEQLSAVLHQTTEGSGILMLNKTEYLYVQCAGSLGLRLISAVPVHHVTANINELNGRFFIVLVCMFSIGMLAALAASRLMYRPIAKLVRDIPNQADSAVSSKGEFNYIRDVLDSLSDENSMLKQQIEGNRAIVHERMTYNLLMGIHDAGINELFRQYWIAKPRYVVLSIHIELLQGGHEHYFIKANVFDKIRSSAFECQQLYIQISSDKACLIIHNEQDIEHLLQFLTGYTSSCDTTIRINVGVGSWVSMLSGIHQSYRQAIEMLDYRKPDSGVNVLRYGSMEPTNSILRYPVERENRIINFLINGNSEDAVALMETTFKENAKDYTPILLLRILCGELAFTVQRSINRLDSPPQELRRSISALVFTESSGIDCDPYRTRLYEICKEMTEFVNRRFEDQENLQIIKAFISEHLGEDISLEMIAAKFDYATSYFSRYFKKNIGVNFLEYITRERIILAKSKLNFTTEEIQTIALEVGFTSSNSFSRAFKQYEGISPTQYRRNAQS